MKSLPVAVQNIIAGPTSRPVVTAEITLQDAPNTVLRVASQHDRSGVNLDIGGDSYAPDLVSPPRIVVSEDDGIDIAVLELNNGDEAYSFYDNNDFFDGARCTIRQYFATNEGYTAFEGPVLTFPGTVSRPETSTGGVIRLRVTPDARAVANGAIGRQITGRCLNDFRDANCGYSHSCTIQSPGTYPAQTLIDINESLIAGQSGLGAIPMRILTDQLGEFPFRMQVRRGGTVVIEDLDLFGTGFASGLAQVAFDQEVTLQAGDQVEFMTCPRDSMRTCATRWQVGSTARQQDRFAGLDYFYGETWHVAQARFPELLDHIVPIAYGDRWVEPVLLGAHIDRNSIPDWASWGTTELGPFVVALIGEGPIQAAINGASVVDFNDNVELDGSLLSTLDRYGDSSLGLPPFDWYSIALGVPSQAPSLFAPRHRRVFYDKITELTNNAGQFVPGLPGLDHIGYVIIELPSDYDLGERSNINDIIASSVGSTEQRVANTRGIATRWSLRQPQVRVRYNGRLVQQYDTAGSPTGVAYTRNPVFQIVDLLTASFRTAASDGFSAGLSTADLDLVSFGQWGAYADEVITVYDSGGNEITAPRFQSDLYITNGNRRSALQSLLQACRGSLVFRNGKIGIICDAPLGGKGTLTGVSGAILSDTKRSDDATGNRTIPPFPQGLLTELTCEFLDGPAAGQTRSVIANTDDDWTVDSAFSPQPVAGDTYVIYAIRIDEDNTGEVVRTKPEAAHDVTNRLQVSWDSNEERGERVRLTIKESINTADPSGQIHEDLYGINEESLTLDATTEYQQAVRLGWYQLRKGLDLNREWEFRGCNIENLPLEVGDLVLASHSADGLSEELLRVVRISDNGDQTYTLTCRLYREHIYANWPDETFDDVTISSTLQSPHRVPPHVRDLTANAVYESSDDNPIIYFTYSLPSWPYAGWHVAIEFRTALDPTWRLATVSKSGTASWRSAKTANYDFRAVFTSQVGARADDPIYQGEAGGGNTATTLSDSEKNWSEDELAGWAVRIESGPGTGEEYLIDSNDADTLVLAEGSSWIVTPTAGSTYKIYRAADIVAESVLDSGTGGGSLALLNFREIERDDEKVKFAFESGSLVDSIWVFTNLVKKPVTSDPWPDPDASPPMAKDTPIAILPSSTGEYEVDLPPNNHLRYIEFQPKDATAQVTGQLARVVLAPLSDAPDQIVGLDLDLDQETGLIVVRVDAVSSTQSYRYAFAFGSPPAWPSDADVEAGFVRTISSSDTFSPPALPLGLGDTVRLRAAPYTEVDGTGFEGVTDHGDIINVEATRTKFRAPSFLELQTTESGGIGTFRVQLVDPDGVATQVHWQEKSGAGAWSAWQLKSGSPADGAIFEEDVALVEGHQSTIRFRVTHELVGEIGYVFLTSDSMDLGSVPTVVVKARIDETTGQLSAVWDGDSDTAQVKIAVSKVSQPDLASVELNALRPGRNGSTPGLITLLYGETGYVSCLGIGPGGERSTELSIDTAVFRDIEPILRITTELEDSVDGFFGVTVIDPAGQADELHYRILDSDTGDWGSWILKSAAPVDQVEYLETTTLLERRHSFIEFRLTYTNVATQLFIHAKSSAFDLGRFPTGSVVPLVLQSGDFSAGLQGDFDTNSWKILALKTGYPTVPSVQASTAIDGRLLTPDDVGILLNLEELELGYITAIPYSGLGGTGIEGTPILIRSDYDIGQAGGLVVSGAIWVWVGVYNVGFWVPHFNMTIGPAVTRVRFESDVATIPTYDFYYTAAFIETLQEFWGSVPHRAGVNGEENPTSQVQTPKGTSIPIRTKITPYVGLTPGTPIFVTFGNTGGQSLSNEVVVVSSAAPSGTPIHGPGTIWARI